jgi:hypothetical protein
LTAFDGEDGNGVWTFEITDTEAFDQGVLIDWSLEISTSDSPGEPSAVTSAAGDYAFSNLPPDQYTVRQIVVAGWEQTFPAGGAGQTVSVPPADPVMGVTFGNHQQGAPPTVLAVEFNTDQTDPPDLPAGMQPTSWQRQRSDLRSIQVTFDRAVVATAADLQLTNLGIHADAEPDTPIMLTDDQLTVDGPRLTISFAAYQLPDGVFALQIQETVTDLTGLPLDGDGDGQGGDAYLLQGDMNNGFYKLAGDFNGDHGNSIFDFPTLAYWFGQSVGPSGAPAYLDLNDDQGVTIFDFSRYAAKFTTIVQFPTALRSTALPGPTNELRLDSDSTAADDERHADRRSSDDTARWHDAGRWHDAVRWPELAMDRDRRDSSTIRRDSDLSTYIQALDQWLAEGG